VRRIELPYSAWEADQRGCADQRVSANSLVTPYVECPPSARQSPPVPFRKVTLGSRRYRPERSSAVLHTPRSFTSRTAPASFSGKIARTWSTPVADGERTAWKPCSWAASPISWVKRWSSRVRVGRRDPERVQGQGVGEVEDLVQVGADLEELSGQQRVDRESLPLGLTRQLCSDARSGQAEVEHREAVRRVEPPAQASRTIPAARVEALGLVPVGDDRERDGQRAADRPWIERRHVRRSRPPPTRAGGRPRAGTARRRRGRGAFRSRGRGSANASRTGRRRRA
jgi:hypothetical protein